MAGNPLEGARKARKSEVSAESLTRQKEISELRKSIASSEQELKDSLTVPPEKRTDAEVIRADIWQTQAKLDQLLKEDKKERKLAKHDDRQERLRESRVEAEPEVAETAPGIKHSDVEAISSTIPAEEISSKAEQKAKLKSAVLELELISEYERRMRGAMEPEAANVEKSEEVEKPEPLAAATLDDAPTTPVADSGEGALGTGRNAILEKIANGGRNIDKSSKSKLEEYIRAQEAHEKEVKRRQKERTEKFANESGLHDLYNKKLQAEHEAYLEELKFQKGNFLERGLGGLGVIDKKECAKRLKSRTEADKATLEWSKALTQATELSPELKGKLDERNAIKSEIYQLNNLAPNEKTALTQAKLELLKGKLDKDFKLSREESEKARTYYEALVIRKRDTIVGPSQLRIQAKIDALPAREKTTFGKVVKGLGWLSLAPLKASSAASGVLGAGLFKAFGNKNLKGADLEREHAKFRRAGQVIMGATIGTAIGIIAAPGTVGAAGGIAGYAAYTTLRSVLGIGVGKKGADFAGWLNKRTLDKSTKEDYHHQVRRTDVESVTGLRKQQEAERQGSRENRMKRDRNIRVGAAVLAGGITSYGIGQAFNHLPAVQGALHHHPLGAPEGHHVGVPGTGEKLQMSIGGPNAEHVNINDSDKLFGHFGKMLERDFAHAPQNQYPALDSYLKLLADKHGHVSLHAEDHMAHAFGFEGKGGLSEVMHKGDTIMLDTKGNIKIVWADHARPAHTLIDAHGKINHDLSDITKHLGRTHEAARAAQHAAPSHEVATGATAAHETASSGSSENLGAAPEPRYDYAERMQDLTRHHENLVREYNELQRPGIQQDSRYLEMYNNYIRDRNNYTSAYQEFTGHAPDTVASAAPEVPTQAAPSHVEASIANAPISVEHFNLNAYHGYEVVDPRSGESGLVFYGPRGDHFIEELGKFAQKNPGKMIQYDAPNAVPPRVETAMYNPQSGLTIMRDLNMEGTKLNPDTFSKEVY